MGDDNGAKLNKTLFLPQSLLWYILHNKVLAKKQRKYPFFSLNLSPGITILKHIFIMKFGETYLVSLLCLGFTISYFRSLGTKLCFLSNCIANKLFFFPPLAILESLVIWWSLTQGKPCLVAVGVVMLWARTSSSQMFVRIDAKSVSWSPNDLYTSLSSEYGWGYFSA